MTKRIVLTGGGTAGHVTPNIELMAQLQQEGWQCHYLGSKTGIEFELISKLNYPFHAISSGKLRRYFSWQNFIDPFKIVFAILQSVVLLTKIKPQVVFSKGGFVAFPVVVAAWLKRIPVICHESDMSPGLATRLSLPFAKTLCVTFEKAKSYFKNQQKIVHSGTPIRQSLFNGNRQQALSLCGFQEDKPCIMIMGGGAGSVLINQVVRQALPALLQKFNVIHLCGKGKVDDNQNDAGYKQFDYVDEALADLFAASEVVIGRSGANAVNEILALAKPHIFIPLSLKASRGDQIQNANFFKEKGISYVIDEEALTVDGLTQAINEVYDSREERIQKVKALNIQSGTKALMQLIQEAH